MAKLILHLPDGSMRDIKLEPGRMTIGRRADNDIHLPFPAVSAEHVAVVTVHTDSFLHDLGSTNGTIVNGNRITKHFLRDHDRIDVGRQHFVYLTNEAETIDPLPPDAMSQELRSLAERVENLVRTEAPRPAPATGRANREHADVSGDARLASADDLLAELMETQGNEAAAGEIADTHVRAAASHIDEQSTVNGNSTPLDEVHIKVLTGPNAGQTTLMTKAEFVFGKQGVQIAAIRRRDNDYQLVPLHRTHRPSINGHVVEANAAPLTFGDTIDVGGVKVRFERRV